MFQVHLYKHNGKLYKWENYYFTGGVKAYECDLSTVSSLKETIELKSTALELKSTIASWYIALRTMALVGLLSVLVYVGIKIILSSSSAQDKAKYKNMLKDWIVALCILFMLHYMMSFMVTITYKLKDMLNANVLENTTTGNDIDVLMTELRKEIGENYDNASSGNTAGYTIMYLAMVILTGVFTLQYLKRVVFVAFLTMIAPMIALTYPLDKIKDSKAQAFSYWMREYIFNCLIQPVHLLLYTVLICSAFDFAQKNVLYAVVALLFMVPAEKFIKEMFGMKSSSPSGTLGAAAGGAMVMSMLNKIRSKPPKDRNSEGASGEPKGVRTANSTANDPSNPNNPSNPSNPNNPRNPNNPNNPNNPRNPNNPNNPNNPSNPNNPNNPNSPSNPNNPRNPRNRNNSNNQNNSNNNNSSSQGTNTITGASRMGRGPGIRGVNRVLSGAGKFTRVLGGAGLGLAAGSVALAAQVADGDLFNDPEKAVAQIAGTAAVGYAAGNNLTGKAVNAAGWVKDTAVKAAMGPEAYNNMKFDRKIYQSDGYKMLANDPDVIAKCNEAGVSVGQAFQAFLNAGITNTTQIREALKNGVGGQSYKEFSDAGVTKASDMATLSSAGIRASDYKAYSNAGVTKPSDVITLSSNNVTAEKYEQFRNAGMDKSTILRLQNDSKFSEIKGEDPEAIRSKKIIANQAQKLGADKDLDTFITFCKRYGIEDEDEIKKFFNNLAAYRLL